MVVCVGGGCWMGLVEDWLRIGWGLRVVVGQSLYVVEIWYRA
jgi:hypothetical protein